MKNVYRILLMLNALFIGANIGVTATYGFRPLIVTSTILLGISTYTSFRGPSRAIAEEYCEAHQEEYGQRN